MFLRGIDTNAPMDVPTYRSRLTNEEFVSHFRNNKTMAKFHKTVMFFCLYSFSWLIIFVNLELVTRFTSNKFFSWSVFFKKTHGMIEDPGQQCHTTNSYTWIFFKVCLKTDKVLLTMLIDSLKMSENIDLLNGLVCNNLYFSIIYFQYLRKPVKKQLNSTAVEWAERSVVKNNLCQLNSAQPCMDNFHTVIYAVEIVDRAK